MVQPINVPGRGIVNFPDDMSHEQIAAALRNLDGGKPPPAPDAPDGASIDDELESWSNYKRKVEHKDRPTIARIPFKDIYDKSPAIFGTLLTDNPDARQQIAQKHLPGSKPGQDRYGNPTVEYNGKTYYMSRPGEFDATDAAKAGGAVIASVPAMVTAPASLPAAAAVGGLTAGAMSLGGDQLTREAGGTAQQVDLGKAAIATVLGTALPFGMAKIVQPLAGKLYALVRSGSVLDDAAIAKLGIDPKILTPELRQKITKAARETFGDPQAAQSAYRQGLGDEFKVDLTKGEISQNAGQQAREKIISGPADPASERIMKEFRVGPDGKGGQDAALNAAQERLRAKVGSGVPLTPDEAGTILKRDYRAADKLAKDANDLLYDKARNPFQLTQDGIPVAAPGGHVGGLSTAVREGVAGNDAARVALSEEGKDLTPNAVKALQLVDKFSMSARGPRAAPVAGQSHPSITSSPELSHYNPRGLLEPTPPGATNTRVAIDQPGTVTHFPAEPPSAESLLSAGVNTTPPGGPRITGPSPTGRSNVPGEVDWSRVIDQRKILTDYADAAGAAGNRTDQAAVAQIIKDFDAHFAPLNPNLDAPRAGHAERMSTFKPGGSKTQDRMTEAALDVMQGPEGGAKVANTIFAPAMKKGEAIQMIDHLNNSVFKDHPEARDVIREQALRRLVTNQDTGAALTPRQTVTAIERAFDGDAEAPLYQRLFSGPQLAELRRFRDLQKAIADGRESPNPSKSGLFLQGILQTGSDKATGAAIGAALGAPFGFPLEGAGLGGATGRGVGQFIPRIQAQSATTPGASYRPPSPQGARALPPSLLAAPPAADAAHDQLRDGSGGPADKIMRSLLMGGP